MKIHLVSTLFLLSLFSTLTTSAQENKLPEELFKTILSNLDFRNSVNVTYKNNFLAKKSINQAIGFEMEGLEPELGGSPSYYPIDSSGIYLIDLDNDNDTDLIYTGINGYNGIKGTQIFANVQENLTLNKQLEGELVLLDSATLHLLWKPCCDGYTSYIRSYQVTNEATVGLSESIYFIGDSSLKESLYSEFQYATVKTLQLFAFEEDFQGLQPYFGPTHQSYLNELKKEEKLLVLNSKIPHAVTVLGEKTKGTEKYYLVLTAPINKSELNLFTGTTGNVRRFVGWVNASQVNF